MKPTLVARIPSQVTYAFREPTEVAIGWDDIEETGMTARVDPAFPVEAGNGETLSRALSWARGDESDAPTTTVPNDPIPEITIVNLEIRDEGGRAYKVALPAIEGRSPYVDLREDVMLDTMLTNGVGVGGVLGGPFIWARVGSQMKLIRVGSVLHRHVVAADIRNRQKAVAAQDLERGGVYSNKKGALFVYLGQCDTDELIYTEYVKNRFTPHTANFKVSPKAHRNVQAWMELMRYEFDASTPIEMQFQARFDALLSEHSDVYGPSPAYWAFGVVKQKAVIERLGMVTVPGNLWERLHALGAAATAHRRNANASARGYATTHWDEFYSRNNAAHPAASAEHALLRLVRDPGAERPKVQDYEQWLLAVAP